MMKNRAMPRKSRGFTLLELLVTVSVATILITVGIPGFRSLTMNSRIIAQTNEFVTSIKMARSAAVRYQRNATICMSSNYDAAVPTCDGGTDWTNGWIVWVDKDRDNATDADEILAAHAPLTGSTTLTSGAVNQFAFDPRGMALGAADDLTLCDDRTAEIGRLVRLNTAGRTSVAEAVCP